MSKKNDCWGVEVGANAVKAVRLVREGSQVALADFAVLPFKKILTTPDLDVDEAIQVNLDQFVQRHDVSRSTIMVSVAGHMAFARFAKLPPIDPKKIPDIVKFEAVQQIPFPIEQVEWDYQVFEQADSPDVEVGIFAIMRERVMGFLENYRTAGLSIDGLTLSPLAVYNALAYDMDLKPDAPGMIFMDIGTTSTDVVVAEEGHTWIRTLPLGGNNFTEALVRSFKLGFPKAEKLKREAATSKYARQIYVAMRPVFADLVQEIQRSLGYYQSLNRNANLTQLVGLGSTFRLPGLRKFLKQQLQIEVIRPDGFRRLTVEGKRASDLSNHALNLATAYGLALQGLGQEKVSANILPKHILKQRLWRSKQPWIGAAAALVVAATVAAGANQWSARRAIGASQSEYAHELSAVLKQGESLRQQWNEIEVNDSRQQIENLQRIPDYRETWPKVLQDVYSAMSTMDPQPQLLKAVYKDIQSIPRDERRRIHIHSIMSEYEFSYHGDNAGFTSRPAMFRPGPGGGAGSGPSESGGTEREKFDPWNPPHDEEEDADDEEDDSDTGDPGMTASLMGGADMAGAWQYRLPSFAVRITGSTSHKTGRKLLTRALKKWLAVNGERRDRPYKIIPLTPEGEPGSVDGIVRWEEVGKTMDGQNRPGMGPRGLNRPRPNLGRGGVSSIRPRDGLRSSPGLRAVQGVRPGAGSTFDPRSMLRPGEGPRGAASSGTQSVDELWPICPLDVESRQQDLEFEIVWRIELIDPKDARATEDAQEQRSDDRAMSNDGSRTLNPTEDQS